LGQSFGLFSTLLVLILVGRAAFVFPLSALSNYIRKSSNTKIGIRQQVIIWWAGLMRGAVSIALAFNQFTISGDAKNPEFATAITTTIGVVLFSTVVFGMLTKPLINWLLPVYLRSYSISDTSDPPSPKDLNPINDFHVPLLLDSEQRANGGLFNGMAPRRSSLSMLLAAPTSYIHDLWRTFDDSYMRPVFGGRGFVPYVPGYLSIAEEDEHNSSHF